MSSYLKHINGSASNSGVNARKNLSIELKQKLDQAQEKYRQRSIDIKNEIRDKLNIIEISQASDCRKRGYDPQYMMSSGSKFSRNVKSRGNQQLTSISAYGQRK